MVFPKQNGTHAILIWVLERLVKPTITYRHAVLYVLWLESNIADKISKYIIEKVLIKFFPS